MRLRLIAVTAVLSAAGVSRAASDPAPVAIRWSLTVTDNKSENHDYVVSRAGGTIKVDADGWKCSYDPIEAAPRSGVYTEAINVRCRAGTHEASTSLVCAPELSGGQQTTNLLITSSQRATLIQIRCSSL